MKGATLHVNLEDQDLENEDPEQLHGYQPYSHTELHPSDYPYDFLDELWETEVSSWPRKEEHRPLHTPAHARSLPLQFQADIAEKSDDYWLQQAKLVDSLTRK